MTLDDLAALEKEASAPKTKRKARVEVINGFFTACVVVVGSFIFFCVFRWILEWAW